MLRRPEPCVRFRQLVTVQISCATRDLMLIQHKVLLNKQHIWCGGAYSDCYPPVLCGSGFQAGFRGT